MICPICNAASPADQFFCLQCGADLSQIPATPKPERNTSAPELESCRGTVICQHCQTANDAGLFLCGKCGRELDPGVLGKTAGDSGGATEPAESSAPGSGTLILMANNQTFVCRDGDILGRNGTIAAEFFATARTVSRRHVSVHLREGSWSLRVCPGVENLTQLDGRQMKPGSEAPLHLREHRLKLSKQCEVTLRAG